MANVRFMALAALALGICSAGCSRESEAQENTSASEEGGGTARKANSLISEYRRPTSASAGHRAGEPGAASGAGETTVGADEEAKAAEKREQREFRKKVRAQLEERRQKRKQLEEILEGIPPEGKRK